MVLDVSVEFDIVRIFGRSQIPMARCLRMSLPLAPIRLVFLS